MIADKKFPIGLIDADNAPHVMEQDAALDMLNLRVTTGKNGDVGYFRNIQGNKLLTNNEDIPAGSEFVGGAISPDGKFIVWFTRNDNPELDQINYYDLVNNRYWLVVRSTMDGVGSILGGLNFTKLIHSVYIIGNIIYWTDNVVEPRKLHIGAAIRASYDSEDTPLYEGWKYNWNTTTFDGFVDSSAISWICKPPAYPPTILKLYDPAYANNLISNESFQFAWHYIYYTGEESTLSMFSESSGINAKGENSNVIDVFLHQDEIPIPSSVRMVRLIVKIWSTKKSFEVKVWDREKPQDAEEIDAFVNGGSLSYRFNYNYIGEAVDDYFAAKPFESVPRLSETVAFCKNRAFHGNSLEGYNNPGRYSSLQLTLLSSSVSQLRVNYFMGRFSWIESGERIYRFALYVNLNTERHGVAQTGFYEISNTVYETDSRFYDRTAHPPPPDPMSVSDVQFVGVDQASAMSVIIPPGASSPEGLLRDFNAMLGSVDFNVVGGGTSNASFLHNNEVHAGIVFYDKFLRKSGVVLPHNYYDSPAPPGSTGGRVIVPQRGYVIDTLYPVVEWTLSNDFSDEEIPEWAHYYAPVLKNKDRLDHFVTGWTQGAKYVRIGVDQAYEYSGIWSEEDVVAVAFPIKYLVKYGLGYTYSEGDMATIIRADGEVFHLPVTGQYGGYIHFAAEEIGDLNIGVEPNIRSDRFVFEIYTPIRSDSDQFFEVGQLYPVLNPGKNTREYSVLEGEIKADTYVFYREVTSSIGYHAMVMSRNDLFPNMWVTDHGRVNVLTRQGERRKLTSISFSNTWISGTSNNGLSAYESLNEYALPIEMGPLRRLITTSKVQGDGDVMLAICENGTASVYIDEAELIDSQGQVALVKSDRVIGSVNTLRGDYGTLNPESVAENKGNVFWLDRSSAAWIKYSANGLFPVSDIKLKSATLELSRRLTDNDLVIGGIHPYHDEYTASIVAPEVQYDPGDYRFKFRSGRTAVFLLSENKTRGQDGYISEGFVSHGREAYAFKAGHLYHQGGGDQFNVFFGVPSVSIMALPANLGAEMKRFLSVGVECNRPPLFTEFKTEKEYVQESSLAQEEYKTREGLHHYANILRDKHSPNTPGDEWDKMYKGDAMSGAYMLTRFTWDTNEELVLKFINLNFKTRHGHK